MDNGLYQVTRFNLEAFAAPLEKLLTDENPQNTASIVDDILFVPAISLAKTMVLPDQ